MQFRQATKEWFTRLSQERLFWPAAIILAYFGARLLYFATAISPYVPPDETTHFEIIRIYAEVPFLPDNSPGTYAYGLVTNIPYLYYWIMGRLLALNFFGIPDLLFLRLLNIPIAFATVAFVWRMFRLVTDDRLAQILLLVAMTNTLMFSFLSASVSYDNLTNLLAAMAIYYLLAFFRYRSGGLLAASFLCQLAGSLTKSTFLPLALTLNILLVIHEFGRIRLFPGALKAWFMPLGLRRAAAALAILAGLALNIHLYGGNYLQYGRLLPEMTDVLSIDKAMQHRITARNTIFNLFREGKVSMQEALVMASQTISHEGDRRGTMEIIVNYASLKNRGVELMGPAAYIVFWAQHAFATAFGILGHLMMLNRGATAWPFAALFLLAFLGMVLRWRPRDAAWLPSCLIAIAVSYCLFLIFGVNYPTYRHYWSPTLALQGRYIFPVLGPLYALFSLYLLRLFSGRYARLIVCGAACVIFISFDFPYFLMHVTPEWFSPALR